VAFGPKIREMEEDEIEERVNEALAAVSLEGRGDEDPFGLTKGERQRVAVARALARRPEVLLLDEPLSALDARTRASASHELSAVLRDVEVPALLVTHDFAEAAQLGDRVGVIDAGRVIQEGTPSELAASPRSAFVADFTGAVVLTGVARSGPEGLTSVELDGGGEVTSTDRGEGPVAVSVYPWEITVEPAAAAPAPGSTQNHVRAEVLSVTRIGNRVRLGLAGPQPLAAEITGLAADELGLRAGARVTASWKASATRLVAI
jgi:molybdate transport system ATP-binding protein